MASQTLPIKSLSSIIELAATVGEYAKVLLNSTEASGNVSRQDVFERPSNNRATTPPGSPKQQHESVIGIRSRLQEACDELVYLSNGPQENVMAIAQSHRVEAALQYAVHFRLAVHVPLEDDAYVSFENLATSAGVSVQQSTRILRLLITCHIFREPLRGFVAHTPESKILLNEDVEAMVGYWTDESFRSAAFFSAAAEKWGDSQERNHTALNLAFDTKLPKFDFFDHEPWRAQRFRRAMAGMTGGDRFSLEHLVNGFDWSSLPKGSTIVDVGGGGGHCSVAIASAHSHLNFIVQDRKAAFEGAQIEEELKSRIHFQGHDFFQPQPELADVYLLRWILHDYPDKYAIRILQAQLKQLKPGSKLIVVEGILLDPGEQRRLDEKKSRILDFAMMSLLNSGERNLESWKALFKAADPNLQLRNAVKPGGSALSVMEVELLSQDSTDVW